uniref:Glycosyltransferase n=1 Tax=Anthurium amnicola TaxID=1678845 RepID=A0A1D1YIU9_9ARAE
MPEQAAMNGPSDQPPHFVLVPFFAPGHMIPMVDIAHLLAERGVVVTVVLTPVNAARIRAAIDRARASGLPIRFVEFELPCAELGLPEGCENSDLVPSLDVAVKFLYALGSLRAPLVDYLRRQRHHHPPPTCMISDMCHPWTQGVADEFGIPRLLFHGFSCFALLCTHNIPKHKVYDTVPDEETLFVIPGLPHRIEITRAQAPGFMQHPGWEKFWGEIMAAEGASYGVVLNSFDELEPLYVESYQKTTGKTAWAIGPACLYNNRDVADRAARGNEASVDGSRCLSWLDSMEPGSVVYACFGSLTTITPPQLVEIGMGLVASGHPFIWVIKANEQSPELEEWLLEGSPSFEERTKGRALVIRGWAPQVAILSHPAVGGFVSHCGWNSSLEGMAAGVPMVTWPHFADQFLNEKLMVEVLGVGVPVGVKRPNEWKSEEGGELVKREAMEEAVRKVMDGGPEGQDRRERARLLRERASRAMEVGGSSDENISRLIREMSLPRPADYCQN